MTFQRNDHLFNERKTWKIYTISLSLRQYNNIIPLKRYLIIIYLNIVGKKPHQQNDPVFNGVIWLSKWIC